MDAAKDLPAMRSSTTQPGWASFPDARASRPVTARVTVHHPEVVSVSSTTRPLSRPDPRAVGSSDVHGGHGVITVGFVSAAMLVVLAHDWLVTGLRDDDAVEMTPALGRYLIAVGRYSCVGCQPCHKYP